MGTGEVGLCLGESGKRLKLGAGKAVDVGLTLGPSGKDGVAHSSTTYGVELSASWGVGRLGGGGGGNGVGWG